PAGQQQQLAVQQEARRRHHPQRRLTAPPRIDPGPGSRRLTGPERQVIQPPWPRAPGPGATDEWHLSRLADGALRAPVRHAEASSMFGPAVDHTGERNTERRSPLGGSVLSALGTSAWRSCRGDRSAQRCAYPAPEGNSPDASPERRGQGESSARISTVL